MAPRPSQLQRKPQSGLTPKRATTSGRGSPTKTPRPTPGSRDKPRFAGVAERRAIGIVAAQVHPDADRHARKTTDEFARDSNAFPNFWVLEAVLRVE